VGVIGDRNGVSPADTLVRGDTLFRDTGLTVSQERRCYDKKFETVAVTVWGKSKKFLKLQSLKGKAGLTWEYKEKYFLILA